MKKNNKVVRSFVHKVLSVRKVGNDSGDPVELEFLCSGATIKADYDLVENPDGIDVYSTDWIETEYGRFNKLLKVVLHGKQVKED